MYLLLARGNNLDAQTMVHVLRYTYLGHTKSVVREQSLPWRSNNLRLPRKHTRGRFHHQTHVNARCIEFCSPERRDNPLLWHRDDQGDLHFNWNSLIQESNNNFISGTRRSPQAAGLTVVVRVVVARLQVSSCFLAFIPF